MARFAGPCAGWIGRHPAQTVNVPRGTSRGTKGDMWRFGNKRCVRTAEGNAIDLGRRYVRAAITPICVGGEDNVCMSNVMPWSRVRVARGLREGRRCLEGLDGTVRRVVRHKQEMLLWVEMDAPLPAEFEVWRGERDRWVLLDPMECEAL